MHLVREKGLKVGDKRVVDALAYYWKNGGNPARLEKALEGAARGAAPVSSAARPG